MFSGLFIQDSNTLVTLYRKQGSNYGSKESDSLVKLYARLDRSMANSCASVQQMRNGLSLSLSEL